MPPRRRSYRAFDSPRNPTMEKLKVSLTIGSSLGILLGICMLGGYLPLQDEAQRLQFVLTYMGGLIFGVIIFINYPGPMRDILPMWVVAITVCKMIFCMSLVLTIPLPKTIKTGKQEL